MWFSFLLWPVVMYSADYVAKKIRAHSESDPAKGLLPIPPLRHWLQ